MELTSLNVKIERNLKSEADTLFNKMGMTLSTAINVFVRQAVQEQAIPFKIYVDDESQVLFKAKEALKEMQQNSVINGKSEMTMEEIDDEIAKYRQEKRAKSAKDSN